MVLLAPLVEIKEKLPDSHLTVPVKVPIIVRYERVMAIFDRDTDATRKYKKELLGSDMAMTAPDIYNELSMLRDLGIIANYAAYKTMPIHDRAKIIAQYQLSNMVSVVKRHDELQAEKNKKHRAGDGKAATDPNNKKR